jgi:PAS domain S-box-containing protein
MFKQSKLSVSSNRGEEAEALPHPQHGSHRGSQEALNIHCVPTVAMLRCAMEESHDCIALLDLRGEILYMNPPGLWLMELDVDPGLTRTSWSELWPRESFDIAEYSLESARSGRACRFTAQRPTARGAVRWWDVAISPIFDRHGHPVQMFCISRDVTEMKAAEHALRQELAAKEMLLREVDHRVKNGLATVAGLLSFQARRSANESVHACLQQAQSRVNAVAAIHRRLYELAKHDTLDIGECIADVARAIVSTQSEAGSITLMTACEHGIALKADRATTLALVTSELITNCIKHAFAQGEGIVQLTLAANPTHLLLRVDDNGRGLLSVPASANEGGIGMTIVRDLVKQLRGELRLDHSGPGAHVRVSVPRDAETATQCACSEA